jgi:DNA-binding IclR family transcriptional regulator
MSLFNAMNKIVAILNESKEMHIVTIIKTMNNDPATVFDALASLLRFRFIEYNQRKEVVRLTREIERLHEV